MTDLFNSYVFYDVCTSKRTNLGYVAVSLGHGSFSLSIKDDLSQGVFQRKALATRGKSGEQKQQYGVAGQAAQREFTFLQAQ